ncbi:hypothetical protein LTR70_002819 [Exophiala xenobiotica]|uniref:Major facilitator superfamily (MFS) profile domain-containing protein n=1 Tax=Lithohypha guttulata TaxID=1690604 RepID=A0ABR0KIX9_9EURO|nr:hypothetical protein LTR24_002033 [Lithohypha guttulata]KAK5324535.1 hypothetical protein LTR70_002819 [Exophiala xenobiotica]
MFLGEMLLVRQKVAAAAEVILAPRPCITNEMVRYPAAPVKSRQKYSPRKLLSLSSCDQREVEAKADDVALPLEAHSSSQCDTMSASANNQVPSLRRSYATLRKKSSMTFATRNRRTRSEETGSQSGTEVDRKPTKETLPRLHTRSMSTWSENESTIAATPSSVKSPAIPPWTLKLPEVVIAAPSLVKETQDELISRGVYTPRPTFEPARLRPSPGCPRPSISRSMSFQSALTTFAPHPGVRPLLYDEEFSHMPETPQRAREDYPNPLPQSLIILGVCLSVFIISLDRGIITTVIPAIVTEYNSYSDVGWYGSAYLLTASAFQPLYGRIYTSFHVKWSFLVAVAVFELGSLICSVAPSSRAFIIGRAIQGLGSAGTLTGSFVVGTHSVRLDKRPVLFAFVGVLYGTGSLCGPMLGGVFSQLITWRWCFYINLPIGAITFVNVFLFFKPYAPRNVRPALVRQPSNYSSMGESFFRRLKALDWIGNTLFTAACTFLFLALQWSQERSSDWSSPRCIAVISLSGFAFFAFTVWLWYKGDEALIPLHILQQRTVAVSCTSTFFIYGALLTHTYYLPIWFQAVKDKSAIGSGIGMVPYMLTNALFSLAAGIFVSKTGHFAPPAIIGCAIGTIGSGLLATLQPSTSTATWAGFQVLVSIGLGMALQQGFSAVQATLPHHEVPLGTAAVVACQSAGGAIFVSVGNTLLQNHLFDANQADLIPGVNIRAVVDVGATNFRDLVPAESLPALLKLYNDALQAVFIAAVPLCGLAFICSLALEWKSVRRVDTSSRYPSLDPENGRRRLTSPELGSDASTLAHLAPRARERWSQRWQRPRGETQMAQVTLSAVPELDFSEKSLMPFEAVVGAECFLAGELIEVEIGKAI